MLYRNPEMPFREPLSRRLARYGATLAATLAVSTRRRRTDLDLAALNPHLKRDLGLEAFRWRGR